LDTAQQRHVACVIGCRRGASRSVVRRKSFSVQADRGRRPAGVHKTRGSQRKGSERLCRTVGDRGPQTANAASVVPARPSPTTGYVTEFVELGRGSQRRRGERTSV